ncbi:hypothetical protein BH11CYA1_BH11CYA1_27430 [soil metagenome]
MQSSDRPASPSAAASIELPVLQPEFAAPLKLGRCNGNSQDFDPQTLELKQCQTPKVDTANTSAIPEHFQLKPYPLIKDNEPINRNLNFSFKLDVPPPQPTLDLRLRFDRATTFDVNFNGQPGEMSLNPRKCGSKARAGLCFKMGF